MATEIELKYLINGENIAVKIRQLLTNSSITFEEKTRTLANCYFDTSSLALRHLDMGLRVRSVDGKCEQTIKTAGVSVGGLQQRPEFNVDIEKRFPTLSLFPEHLWQNTAERDAIQDALVSIFSTDFVRTMWLITLENGSQVELAYDQGAISVNGRDEQIHEVELELVKGEREELFTLAKMLFTTFNLRPGLKSKAARGYALWQNLTDNTPSSDISAQDYITLIPLQATMTIEEAFNTGITFGLLQLQNLVDEYLTAPDLVYLVRIKHSLQLLTHGIDIFAAHQATSYQELKNELAYFINYFSWVEDAIHFQELITKSGNYRKKLEFNESLIEMLKETSSRLLEQAEVANLFESERFNLLQLALLEKVIAKSNDDTCENLKLAAIAKLSLQKGLDDILHVIQIMDHDNVPLLSQQYIQLSETLEKSLLSGYWFGALYPEEARSEYRMPWLDMDQGIDELKTLMFLQKQLQLLPNKPDNLALWLDAKIENLILALAHSKQSAVNLPPYWF